MPGLAFRLLHLAPAITFGLFALFVGASYWLGVSPADPASWKIFLTLAPLAREPVYVLDNLHGAGYGVTFLSFIAMAAGCVAITFLPGNFSRFQFATSHLAFLAMIYSVTRASASLTSISAADPAGVLNQFHRALDFSSFPASGFVLITLVVASCLAVHVSIIRRLFERARIEREIDDQISALLASFR